MWKGKRGMVRGRGKRKRERRMGRGDRNGERWK
jgi:hypothetical protein